MTVIELLKDLGIFSILIAGLGWIAREIGKHLLNKNIKIHELELNQQLVKFKSELELIAQKQNKLHDKRLDVIHEFYGLLSDFYINLDNLTRWKNVTGKSEEQIEKEKLDDVKNTYESGYKFSIFYEKNKLYFSTETCLKIEEINKILRECQYDLTIQYQWMNISVDMQMTQFEKAREKIRTKVPELKLELESNFRKIIGVE